jgi:phosphoribosylformimino-5-aminoimidazole carboxamide ribotide isomerase
MILFPAIDLKDNQCVRLVQGRFDDIKVYSQNPVEVALNFINQGATAIHIVDLDGAKSGNRINFKTIKAVVEKTNAFIQVGGGIRSLEDAEELLKCGVSRVIIGTLALENKALVKEMVDQYPNQIIVSIDASHGMIATHGWKNVSSIDSLSYCRELEEIGIDTIVYTDISKDGMLQGPNFDIYEALSKETKLNIIASGGISELNDLVRLNNLSLYGTIIGKALYENRFTLKEALACLQKESSLV